MTVQVNDFIIADDVQSGPISTSSESHRLSWSKVVTAGCLKMVAELLNTLKGHNIHVDVETSKRKICVWLSNTME